MYKRQLPNSDAFYKTLLDVYQKENFQGGSNHDSNKMVSDDLRTMEKRNIDHLNNSDNKTDEESTMQNNNNELYRALRPRSPSSVENKEAIMLKLQEPLRAVVNNTIETFKESLTDEELDKIYKRPEKEVIVNEGVLTQDDILAITPDSTQTGSQEYSMDGEDYESPLNIYSPNISGISGTSLFNTPIGNTTAANIVNRVNQITPTSTQPPSGTPRTPRTPRTTGTPRTPGRAVLITEILPLQALSHQPHTMKDGGSKKKKTRRRKKKKKTKRRRSKNNTKTRSNRRKKRSKGKKRRNNRRT